MTAEDRHADLSLAISAAVAAGLGTLEAFGGTHDVSHKGPDQPLTPADLEADRLLKERLLSARAHYGWLSEETVDRPDRLARRRVWVVDPIDGTRSYIAGRPEFAVSVGLAEEGAALLGVVFNPASREIFWAVRGAGAFVAEAEQSWSELSAAQSIAAGGAGRPLRISPPSKKGVPRLVASRSEIAAGELDPFRLRYEVAPLGSTAYKLAAVAAGVGHAFLSRGPKSEWDVCAGGLVVQEAGGHVTDLDGGILRYNRPDPFVYGVLAAAEELHAALLGDLKALPPSPRIRESRRPDELSDRYEE